MLKLVLHYIHTLAFSILPYWKYGYIVVIYWWKYILLLQDVVSVVYAPESLHTIQYKWQYLLRTRYNWYLAEELNASLKLKGNDDVLQRKGWTSESSWVRIFAYTNFGLMLIVNT